MRTIRLFKTKASLLKGFAIGAALGAAVQSMSPAWGAVAKGGCTLSASEWRVVLQGTSAAQTKGHPQVRMTGMRGQQVASVHSGAAGAAKTVSVSSLDLVREVLNKNSLVKTGNGIAKLYVQLLVAKLNILSGAASNDIQGALVSADEFLSKHNHLDWDSLSTIEKNEIIDWKEIFDAFNNGIIGPGHCSD